jgi:hypothetical protein
MGSLDQLGVVGRQQREMCWRDLNSLLPNRFLEPE